MPAKKTPSTARKKPTENIYQLKITLVHSKPPIWRRFLVSDRTVLPDLHRMIQAAMGWTNSHLHQFMHMGDYLGHPTFLEDMDVLDYRKIRIGTILRRPKDSLKYEYDFGDGWLHDIVLQKIHPKVDGVTYPFFMDGEGNCPPEDCGGIPGFQHFLYVMADPNHKEYDEMIEWYGQPYDPAHFDPLMVGRRFRSKNYGVYDFFAGN